MTTITGLHALLFLIYLIVICLVIKKSSVFSHAVLSKNLFVGIFLLRSAAGLAYGYIYSRPKYIIHSDAWAIFRSSITEYKLLLHDPWSFVKTSFLLDNENTSFTSFAPTDASYWNVLKEVLLIKFEALLNVLSFGNYYVNMLLFGFLIMQGCNLFFRALESRMPNLSYINLFSAFLVPSTMFWTSAVYKDGILLVLMFLSIRQTQKWLDQREGNLRYILVLTLSLTGLFFLRTYSALLLVPAIALWIVSENFKINAWKTFGLGYAFCLLAVLTSAWLSPEMNPIKILAAWQNAFMKLEANSALPVLPLEASAGGLLKNFPQSFGFAFLRPLLWENKGLQYLPFAVELTFLQMLFLYAIYKRSGWNNLNICLLALGLSGLLLLGYTVNIIGAIVRYRSIYMPFLFAAVLSSFSPVKLNKIYRFRRNQ